LTGLLLAVLAPCCILVSPYALELPGYYHLMLANPLLTRYVSEWQRSWPGTRTAVFYLVLAVGAWRLVGQRRRVPVFDLVAFALLALVAVQALRGIVWFGLAAVPILAPQLDPVIARIRLLASPAAARVGLALAAAGLVVVCVVLARPSSWFVAGWPAAAASNAATLAAHDPSVRIFADDRHADWLLWSQPSLRGRVAYDVRFELLTPQQFRTLRAAKPSLLRAYGVFVSSPRTPICRGSGCRTVYRDAGALVARS
jgi:hypothetical protein